MTCGACSSGFGFLTRRHHCRQCGRIFCGRCSEQKWPVAGITSRVCKGCYLKLSHAHHEKLKQQQHSQYEAKKAHHPNSHGHGHGHGAAAAAASASSSTALTAAAAKPNSTSTSSSSTVASRTAAQLARESIERVIYHTASLCPKCSLLEKRGFDQYKPAQLLEQYRGIWLRMQCELHGPHVTLVCKERSFWWRCYGFQEVWNASLRSSGLVANNVIPRSINQGISSDMEDMGQMLAHSLKSMTPPPDNLPISFELTLFTDGAFVPDADLDARLLAFLAKWPQQGRGGTFLLKLIGGLVDKAEIPALNAKILRIVGIAATATPNPLAHPILTPALLNVRILVDVSYERLLDLLLLDDSVFLKVRVLPCVRYFLGPGEESQFISEMDYLVSIIRGISDLELVLSLSVESPFPDLGRVLEYVKTLKGVVRFVLLQRERSPRDILGRLHAEARQAASAAPMPSACAAPHPDLAAYPESTDPYELLEALEAGSGGLVRTSDFVPMSIAQILEPAAAAFGYGQYHFNPAPFCGFMATLVSTEKLHSIPLTRLFDMEQLYAQLVPVAQKLKYSNSKPSIGIMVAKQIQKALKACAYNVEVSNTQTHNRPLRGRAEVWSDLRALAFCFSCECSHVLVLVCACCLCSALV